MLTLLLAPQYGTVRGRPADVLVLVREGVTLDATLGAVSVAISRPVVELRPLSERATIRRSVVAMAYDRPTLTAR